MPQPLPSPYMAEAGPVLQAWRTGQSDRLAAQQRGALQEAGKLAATGSLGGARTHLLGQGMFDEANQIAAMMRQADDQTLAKAKRTYEVLGNLALASDTPEKWQAALAAAAKSGMDVSKYQDFGARDMVLAQAGMVGESIENQLKERALNAKDKPIEINGNLVERQPDGTYKSVYAAPPKQEGLMSVSPGQTILDPNTRQPVYTAPAKEEGLMSVAPGTTVLDPATRQPVFSAPEKTVPKKYEFTKYGVGDPSTGEIKPYQDGQVDPELTLERGKYEQGLRKEYTALTSDLRTINDSLGRMRTSSKINTGAGDIAMVYSYMKMLDPTSVVREGEYATAENTGGIPERISNVYNKILTGQRLTPEQRSQFLESGEALTKDKVDRFRKLRSQFENIATKTGADPNRIMLDEGTPGEGQIDPRAVDVLKSDPSPQRIQQFEEVFGPGSAQRVLGR